MGEIDLLNLMKSTFKLRSKNGHVPLAGFSLILNWISRDINIEPLHRVCHVGNNVMFLNLLVPVTLVGIFPSIKVSSFKAIYQALVAS